MGLNEKITIIQDKIDKINIELSTLEEQIKKVKDEIIPNLIVFVRKTLMEKAEDFYIDSKYEISNPKTLKKELGNTIEEIGNDLIEELKDNSIWDFNKGKDKDLYIYEKELDLLKNKKLCTIIRNSPKKIDNLFKKYNFPIQRNSYGHSEEYHSPYGINFYRMEDIFGYEFEKNSSLDILNNINDYWKIINKKFESIESVESLSEDLRKLKREQDWES